MLVISVLLIISAIGLMFVMFIFPSFRVLLYILMFTVSGFINARLSIKLKETLQECIKVDILIILIFMLLTRIAYAIVFSSVEPFNVINFVSCFLAYFFVSSITSLLVYYLEGEL